MSDDAVYIKFRIEKEIANLEKELKGIMTYESDDFSKISNFEGQITALKRIFDAVDEMTDE